jgi:hypothetical protein
MNQENINANILFFEQNPRLTEELKRRGLNPVPTVPLEEYAGGILDSALCEALLASLDFAPNTDSLQSYLGLLARTVTPYSASKVISIFENAKEHRIKFSAMHALAYSNAVGAVEWFVQQLINPEADVYRRMAAGYSAQLKQPSLFLPILRQHYSQFPINALQAFYRIGGSDELFFLNEFDHNTLEMTKEQKKEYNRWLEKTKKKLQQKTK